MPINRKDDGWYWGSKGPFKSKDKAEEVQRAAYASGYQKLMKDSAITDRARVRPDPERVMMEDYEAERATKPKMTRSEFNRTVKEIQERLARNEESLGESATSIDLKRRGQEQIKSYADKTREDAHQQPRFRSTESLPVLQDVLDENELIQEGRSAYEDDDLEKEGGGDGGGTAGIGTVAISSDPGVFTETYGARKRKVMNRKGKGSKSSKSGPEKLDDFLNNSYKSLDDESFLVELVGHVLTELRKAGEGPTGVYTPYNERPYQPAYPQELKQKGPRASREINRSPTTENTVPVSSGEGSLGQSKVPQETVLAPPGVDDQRNMNRSVAKKKPAKSGSKITSISTGAFLTPGNESGMNFQAMQKIGTHGNELANSPKQFGTERPQAAYIEKKPRLDPNSDIEQEEFVGNVDSIRDEDKNRKGRTYENNKEGNNFNSKQIDTYTMNMGGHALQAFTKEMRDVGLDSLHRQSDDDITEPDEENTEELKRREEEEELPEDIDIIEAEKSALNKMRDWFNDV